MTDTKTVNAKAFLERAKKSFPDNSVISTASLGIIECLLETEDDDSTPVWTPCSEGLPSEGQEVLFDVMSDMNVIDLRGVYKGKYEDGTFWIDECDHEAHIGAQKQTVAMWMPCPEFYNPDHIRDATKKVDQFREPTKMMQNDMRRRNANDK